MIDEVNTTTINQITQANLRSTIVPIPPLAEQRRIVVKVNQLMTLVDKLETQLATNRTTSKALLNALVRELTSVS
jgi:type I restriction enzyme S subunit